MEKGVHSDCYGCQFGDPENYPCQYGGDPANCEPMADKALDSALKKLLKVIGIQIGQISELRQALRAAGWLSPCEGRIVKEGQGVDAFAEFSWEMLCALKDNEDKHYRLILDPLPKKEGGG